MLRGQTLTIEDRLRNPFTDSQATRRYTHSQLYKAAFVDPRYSSSFGMYPTATRPSRWKPGAWLVFKFGFVGGLGLFLNEYIMYLLTRLNALSSIIATVLGGSFYVVYAVISSQGAVLVNFFLNEGLVFKGRKGGVGFLGRFAFFNSLASADLLVRIPILWSFTTFLGVPSLVSNFESILITFGGRFAISTKKIWPSSS
jgi:putative flippase GtrA